MRALTAIVFDFDGVVADCRQSILLPGAASFVRTAAAAVPIAIASGAVTREIDALLDAHDLRHVFAAIVGADQALRSKPSPDPFLEALFRIERAGYAVDPRRSVAIDDSVSGLVAARTARMRCVGIGRGARADELVKHAELVVSGLDVLTLDTLDTLVRESSRS